MVAQNEYENFFKIAQCSPLSHWLFLTFVALLLFKFLNQHYALEKIFSLILNHHLPNTFGLIIYICVCVCVCVNIYIIKFISTFYKHS